MALAACGDDPSIVTGGGTVTTSAGTVEVECLGRYRVRIVGSTPAPGYTAKLIVAGPATQASLRFESPTANDFRVAVHCRDAQPRVNEWEVEDTTLSQGLLSPG
jgi:hypothetical protein